MRTEVKDFITELQDLRYLDWTDRKMSPGTPGSFLKAYEETEAGRYYYKLSNYDSYRGIFGHECVNELVVSRLLSVLAIPHLEYQLVYAWITIADTELKGYLCKSKNFRKEDEKKIAFDTYYELYKEGKESPYDFAKRNGWEDYVCQMFIADYLIGNRDRHGANIELLIDENERVKPAPLFDNGVSLLFSCYDNLESIRKFDVLEDKAVNNFIGSRSLEYNLKLMPKGKTFFDGTLRIEDREKILGDLGEILPGVHLEKIWEMIWERWQKFVQVCY